MLFVRETDMKTYGAPTGPTSTVNRRCSRIQRSVLFTDNGHRRRFTRTVIEILLSSLLFHHNDIKLHRKWLLQDLYQAISQFLTLTLPMTRATLTWSGLCPVPDPLIGNSLNKLVKDSFRRCTYGVCQSPGNSQSV